MTETSPWSLALAAVPALIKMILPSERRGVGHRLGRVLEMYEKTPEGEGRKAPAEMDGRVAQQLAHLEDRRLRRRVDGANLGTIVFVVVVGGTLGFVLWQVDHIVGRIAAFVVIGFVTLLVLVGGLTQVVKTTDRYPYEEQETETRRNQRRSAGR